MQQRHLNRRQYFCELAKTASEFYLDYLKAYITLTSDSRVLEIGCGEGGNLLPFAEMGCHVTGVDICKSRISEAQTFFTEYHRQGTFICMDFLLSEEPKTEEERYDLVLVHDVIEHIEASNKRDFLLHIKSFLKQNGIAFFGFPAWQNPFGGHQQISVGLASKLPFIHLLPKARYTDLLRKSGATEGNIRELMSIRASRVTVEGFECMVSETGYAICQRTLWLINPHYKQKFHMNPRRQWTFFACIHLRNFYTTSAWYLLRQTPKQSKKMKRLFQIFVAALLSATSSVISSAASLAEEQKAQHRWAMAFIEKGKDIPTVVEYHSVQETAENGIEYYRVIDDGYHIRGEAYNPVELPYGYRWTGMQMYIYDFENAKETLAFDFNLNAGDHFTTFNGMEWEIEMVKDTLVNISFQGKGENVTKKLLTVRTLDGTLSDQWLEDCGSLSGHFMINSLENVECTQTLWVEYGMGEYLAREISTGPIFAHDSGWLDGTFCATVMPYTVCTYKDGQVMIEDVEWWYEHRDYACFYRDGDSIRELYRWELEPHSDLGNSALRRDVFNFYGLPEPKSGQYTILWNDSKHATNISSVHATPRPIEGIYDLQGRRIWSKPSRGIYIKNGIKAYAK